MGKKQEGILSAAFMMMVLLALTKFVGFFKLHIFARFFGASKELDVFWAAFTIPDIIFNIVAVGSINAALIPLFSEKLSENGKRVSRFFAKILNFLILIFIVLGVFVFIFAPQISNFIANNNLGLGSSDFNSADVELLTRLTRIMIFSPIILGVSSVFSAGIQVNKRFIVPALAPLFYNIGIVLGTIVTVKYLNMGIPGLAISVWVGTILHLLVQIPLAYRLNLKFRPLWGLFSENVVKAVKLSLPRVFGLIGEQVSIFVNTIIAIGLGAGSLSAYKYGSSIHLLPIHLIGSTIAIAALPTLSIEYNKLRKGEKSDYAMLFVRSAQQILFFIMPAMVFTLVLRLPIVRLVLGAGNFDWTDTVVTSWVLALFVFAMFGESLLGLIVRAFYAMKNTVTPVITSFISLGVNILGSIYFTNFFSHYYDWRPVLENIRNEGRTALVGYSQEMIRWFTTRNSSFSAVGGLALSAGIAVILNCIMLMVILNRKVKVMTWDGFIKPFLKKLLASVVMFITMYYVYQWWNFNLDTSTVLSIVGLFSFVGGIGFLVYLLVAFTIDIREISIFIELYRRLKGKFKSIEIQ
ncbi:MAG: murein biosynthesis integral membrane protein MurJ [bacterium]